jgi:hypothetical protein
MTNTLQSGFYASRVRERPDSQVHRPCTGPACNIYAHVSPLRWVLRSSTGRPRREFKLQARVHRSHSGPARLLMVTQPVRVLRPRSRGRPAQSGSSAPHPGRVGLQPLLSAAPGSTVLNRPAPLGSLGLPARVHRAHSGPGPPAQVTRLGQGSTPPHQGTARPIRSVRFIDPAPGRPDCSRTPLGFFGPAPGVGPL